MHVYFYVNPAVINFFTSCEIHFESVCCIVSLKTGSVPEQYTIKNLLATVLNNKCDILLP